MSSGYLHPTYYVTYATHVSLIARSQQNLPLFTFHTKICRHDWPCMIDHDRLAMIGHDDLECSKSLALDVEPIQRWLEFRIRYQLKTEEIKGREKKRKA